MDGRFFQEPETSGAKILSKYDISKKYILFLGTLDPSKNIAQLLEAFAKFKNLQKKQNGGRFDYQLVLAGKRGWMSKAYPQIIKDLGLIKDVIFTGYIIGDELVPLFRGAEFFVMPSFHEGFGMTVLEAFATQTPAIVSNVASLPEIAGDAALFVDPMSVEDITNAMSTLANDPALCAELRAKGLEQAKKFDWEKTAQQTLEIYQELGKNN